MSYDASHAEHAQNLLSSEGWKLIKTWLEGRVSYHKEQLVNCKLEEIEGHRAHIRAYKNVLIKPQGIIDEATEVEQRS